MSFSDYQIIVQIYPRNKFALSMETHERHLGMLLDGVSRTDEHLIQQDQPEAEKIDVQ